MIRARLVLPAVLVAACGGPQRPTGPPPEYERPVVAPWDSGVAADPLENVEGEWVTDEPEPVPQPDGGAEAGAGDAGEPVSDAGPG